MTADPPATTIAVVGREAFSPTPATLERVLRHTPDPRRVVVVDGDSPRPIRRRLDELARAHDITLLRSDAVLAANEARNLATAHVSTEFVVFLDNDTEVGPGWLEGLERCARESGAAVVVPVVLSGPTASEEVHFAGGSCHVVDEPGARRLVSENTLMHRPPETVATLSRRPSELLELHCTLVRTDVLARLGGFDERFVAGREEADLSLAVATAGEAAVLEPRVVVAYVTPKALRRYDHVYFRARWSGRWARRSFGAFNAKWSLDATTEIDERFLLGHRNRRIGVWPGTAGPGGWRAAAAWKLRRALDLVVTPAAARLEDRRRARAAPARVVRRASWDVPRSGAPRT